MSRLTVTELDTLYAWANAQSGSTVVIQRGALLALINEVVERREVDRNLVNQRKTGMYTRSRRGRR